MNQFTYRGPIAPDSSQFRGRVRELQHLKRLCAGQVQAYAIVYGGRQNGKTSLLLRLAHELKSQATVCRVDCQSFPGADIRQAYSYLARRIGLSLGDSAQPVQVNDSPSFTEFLNRSLRSNDIKHFVLLLEEMGALSQSAREDLANVLRSIFTSRYDPDCQSLAKFMAVLAGSIELYSLAATEVSTLHNVCESIYLNDLNKEDAVAVIAEGMAHLGMSSAESVVIGESVFEYAQGHPYVTQRFGSLIEATLPTVTGTLSSVSIDKLADQILEDDPLLNHLRKALKDQQLLLAAQSLLAGNVRFSRFDEDMARLELIGLAREINGYWSVRNQLFKRALRDWSQDNSITAPSSQVDIVEIRLRGLIDVRLNDVCKGQNYWKSAIPGDVSNAVRDRINESLSRHPYENHSQFTTGKSRLAFCDVSDYEKIILRNWLHFEQFFKRKDEFQRHMVGYRTLRNCVQHNRVPTEIELKSGEAGMLWLERILDKFEQGDSFDDNDLGS